MPASGGRANAAFRSKLSWIKDETDRLVYISIVDDRLAGENGLRQGCTEQNRGSR